MINIVRGPNDLKGCDVSQLHTVYRIRKDQAQLVAVASSDEEAEHAVEMLIDLHPGHYHVAPPSKEAN